MSRIYPHTAIIVTKRVRARERDFGIIGERRREYVRHGYLLALEEVEDALDMKARFEELAAVASDAP